MINISILFTADTHFGHKNVIRFDNRPFTSVEEMDQTLIDNWQRKVKPEDTVYVLGDISWHNDAKTYDIFNNLNGSKILLKGNHDRVHGKVRHCFEDIKDYDELHLPGNIHISLSHWPIKFFNRRHYGAYMFYAHVHNSKEWLMVEKERRELEENGEKCNMFNVGTMHWNFEPVTFEEIINNYPKIISNIFKEDF